MPPVTESVAKRPGAVFALVLGEMQDAGIPHIGCHCAQCTSGRVGYAASLAVVDTRGEAPLVFLIDATPDIKYQLRALAKWLEQDPRRSQRTNPPAAVFISHAHLGHVGGLPQFGPEAMAVSGLPVYTSASLALLLLETRLWAPVVENLEIRPCTPHLPICLAPDLSLTPIPVPHRDEGQVGTFAFLVQGPAHSLLYLPDIDDWQMWSLAKAVLARVDTALVDGSFFSLAELAGRPPAAHPLIPDTLSFFADWPGELVFTHFNHTNPVLNAGSAAAAAVRQAGARLAYAGMTFNL